MKLSYTLLSIILLLAKAGFAQPENDITTLKNNKVLSVTSYHINTVESKVEECLNTPSWYKANITDSNVYDSKGNIVLHRLFEFQNRKTYYDTRNEYNSAGLLIKSIEYNNDKKKSTDSICYNKENLIAYRKMYYNYSNYLFYEIKVEYTLKGKLPVETRAIDPPSGNINTTTVKTFDAKDRLTEEIMYMGNKEKKKIESWKKYVYHNAQSGVIKEIQTYHRENGNLQFVQKFDNSGFLIENISYNPKNQEIIDKTIITKENNQIVETYWEYVQEEDRLPASSGNADETAGMIHGEKAFKPVSKKVTTLLKNGLREITKTYKIDFSGQESYDRTFKYEYQYSK